MTTVTPVTTYANPTMPKKIAVLSGGPSSEHEISLASGRNVAGGLRIQGHRIEEITVGKDGSFSIPPEELTSFDICFIAMHGPYGEDGTIQAILESIGVPYTGSDAKASFLGMDKIASRSIWLHRGLPVVPFEVVRSEIHAQGLPERFPLPLVFKPFNQGSSVGVSIVKSEDQIKKAYEAAASFSVPVMVDRYIQGREINAGILGEEPLPLIEIVPKKEFFDYEAKYNPSLADEITPAPLDRQTTERIQEVALRAFKALGCRGFARVDLFLGEDGEIYLSEINTIPGLTENSLFPKEAKAAGIEFPQLLEKIIYESLPR